MNYFKEDVLEASKLLKIDIDILSLEKGNEILQRLANNFFKNKLKYPLWENLPEAFGFQTKNGWEYLKEFTKEKKIILFFNNYDEKTMFDINDGSQVSDLIAECSSFEFYITDDSGSFIICYNHHDYLIGIGKEAIIWLKKLSHKIKL